jgi:hypothetical protein
VAAAAATAAGAQTADDKQKRSRAMHGLFLFVVMSYGVGVISCEGVAINDS